MAKVLDSLQLPIKKNGTTAAETYVNNPKVIAGQFSASTAYTVGQYVFYEKKLYRFKAAHAAGAWNSAHVDEVTVASELVSHGTDITQLKADLTQLGETVANKANIDGSYDTMTVGNAKQLTSNVGINDKAPYLFRTAGGANDIGDREEDVIVGGTIVWNQIFPLTTFSKESEGLYTAEATGDGEWTVNLLVDRDANINSANLYYSSTTALAGHVYAFLCDSNHSGLVALSVGLNKQTPSVFSPSADTNLGNLRFYTTSIVPAGTYKLYPMLFDLTIMFGTTIANYVLSLETATAGAGIAWLKRYGFLSNKRYQRNNPATLKSVGNLTAHKMTGFNQWDEEWEVGDIYSTNGANKNASDTIRSKNYIPVIPGVTYYFKSSSVAVKYYYDENKAFLGSSNWNPVNTTITFPNNVRYIRFRMNSAYGTTYKNDICLSIHWDGERDGEYEAYKEYTYPLDQDVILRGEPKLDSNNELYYYGDVYEPDGTVTRNYVEIDMGDDLTWISYNSSDYPNLWYADLPCAIKLTSGYSPYSWVESGYLKSLTLRTSWATIRDNDKSYSVRSLVSGHPNALTISNSDFAGKTSAQVSEMLSGKKVVFMRATAITETADPFQTPQVVDDWGTEEYVCTPDSDGVVIPVGHDTFYSANLKAKLEMAPDSPGDGDGDYIVRQTGGLNEYAKLVIPNELPTSPSDDGSYTLKVTVSDGTATLAWVADT